MIHFLKTLVLFEFHTVIVVNKKSKRAFPLLFRSGTFLPLLQEGEYSTDGIDRMFRCIHPEDREHFREEAQFDHVIEQIATKGKAEIQYRIYDTEGLCRYRRLLYLPAEDGENILIAMRDETKKMLEHVHDANMLALTNSCIHFMVSNLCENLMVVDVHTGQSMAITAAGNGKLVPQKRFQDQIRWFADNVVVLEEREHYLHYFDLGTLVAHIRESGGTASMFCTVRYEDGRHELLIRSTLLQDAPDLEGEHVLLFAQDITSIRKIEEANRQLAHSNRYDKLTGLLNRATAEKIANDYLHAAGVVGSCCFLLIDIDNFKKANDQFGHLVGDDVLKWLGQSMRKSFRAGDVLCRWGGDEFVIFLRDVEDQEGIRARLGTLRSMMLRCRCGTMSLPVTLSVGGTFGIGEVSLTDLYSKADQALYQVKKKGRNGVLFL